ncbi:cytochrome-c peroxidase [Methylobacterium sp. J-070]|uniref:cytochrome-c peroxidase n=1 Tax=Methylobacterium sp. J-070 TaxID=2836650 RepID=UPI001FBA9D29|nr:cytochrome-c peroxidase [Methylobacterium sp. J-070]MCJ2050273.1 cytochrome-c peroxidase [Methylobacterium sp. J-070]
MLAVGSLVVESFPLQIGTKALAAEQSITLSDGDTLNLFNAANETFKPIPSIVPSVKGNPITREKVDLGRMLWFDWRLSASGVISCNSCHSLAAGGSDNVETSIGHGWQKGPRNSPTVLNAIFNAAQFWDGRADDLRSQARGPIQAAVEMASTPDHVIDVLKSIPEYRDKFATAFPGEPDAVTFDNVTRALEDFEATLITPASRFDQFLEGNLNILTAQEKRGLRLFMDTGCSGCHNGVNVGGQDYFPFGVVERPGSDVLPPEDKGRFAVTKTATDEYVFRAVPLRNVALTAPYFHSGKVWSLEQAVAIMGTAQLGKELTAVETSAIAAFLRTLTGQAPRIELPILPPSTAQTPRPETFSRNALRAGDASEKIEMNR